MSKQNTVSIGGQALIEGIMMKGVDKTAVVVRGENGSLECKLENNKQLKLKKIPILRGIEAFLDSIITGYKHLMFSADIALQEEETTKFEVWLEEKMGSKSSEILGTIAALLGGLLALVLFMVLPTVITGLVDTYIFKVGAYKAAMEGVCKLVIFTLYLYLIGLNSEASRLFRYHGAEHKTIACFEAGDELTVENVKKHTRFHPRCGTSFIFIVLIISIIIFSFIPWQGTLSRVGLKLIALPLVMGISYEVLKFNGKYTNTLTKVLSAPGMWFQRLTTQEPDDSMIEVAIKATNLVLGRDEV